MARAKKAKVDKTLGRDVFVIWCENVRREAGNKLSFMGCFGQTMILPKIPTVLPDLAAQIWIKTPLDKPLKEFTLSLMSGENEVFSHHIGGNESTPPVAKSDDEATHMLFQMGVALRDFSVDQPHKLFFQVSSVDGVFKSTRLSIREATDDERKTLIEPQLVNVG